MVRYAVCRASIQRPSPAWMTSPLNLPAPGRYQAVYIMFPFSTAMCFVKQLPGPILCASPCTTEDPLSRSYRVNLPSSLTVNHSGTSVFSARRVSVCSTGAAWISLADFLGSMVTSVLRCASAPYTVRFGSRGGFAYHRNRLTLQPAIPSARQDSPSPSRHSMGDGMNINPFFHRRRRSAFALGPDSPDPISVDQETLVFRRGGFSPPLSLLIPTFAFPCAPTRVIPHLRRRMECSPTMSCDIHGFSRSFLCRLLSTPDRSTSELLRTLLNE